MKTYIKGDENLTQYSSLQIDIQIISGLLISLRGEEESKCFQTPDQHLRTP